MTQQDRDALDDWRWEQAERQARAAAYKCGTKDFWVYASHEYRRLAREDVRPEGESAGGEDDVTAAKRKTAIDLVRDLRAQTRISGAVSVGMSGDLIDLMIREHEALLARVGEALPAEGRPPLVITDKMIEAGVSAIYRAIGYQLEGTIEDGVEAVFEAMLRASNTCAPVSQTASYSPEFANLQVSREGEIEILENDCRNLGNEVHAALSEIWRLREALTTIVSISEGSTTANNLPNIAQISRAALEASHDT